jgi:hypothetical protein
MNLPRIVELLFDRRGRGSLKVLAESSSGVGETPRGQLDAKAVERFGDKS